MLAFSIFSVAFVIILIPHFLLSSSKKKTDDLRTKGVSLT